MQARRRVSHGKTLFVCWTPNSTRSATLCHYLEAQLYCSRLYFRPSTRVLRYGLSPIRYVLQGIETLLVLASRRPERILVENPPVFAAFSVWVYCLFAGACFITDNHSAAFDRTRWRVFLSLFRFLGRRALTNIVHNSLLEETVRQWGLETLCIGDLPLLLPSGGEYPVRSGFTVVAACSFDEDEPVDIFAAAAKRLPDVTFYITGDLKRAPRSLARAGLPNLVLTGFLPAERYAALLKRCGVVVALTTHDATLQNAALEAVQLERPIITSRSQVLQDVFCHGTVHINNTPEELTNAVQEIRLRPAAYLQGILALKREMRMKWARGLRALNREIGFGTNPSE
jgi:glycosyltransferase involved in cell wall biosynthesis